MGKNENGTYTLIFIYFNCTFYLLLLKNFFFNNTTECLIFFLIGAIGNSFCKFLARIIFLGQNIVWLEKEEKLFTPLREVLSPPTTSVRPTLIVKGNTLSSFIFNNLQLFFHERVWFKQLRILIWKKKKKKKILVFVLFYGRRWGV